MLIPLAAELIYSTLPCGVYVQDGMAFRWHTGCPVSLPTHILWNMYGAEDGLTGEITERVIGAKIGPVPAVDVKAGIGFTADVPGDYYAYVETMSDAHPEAGAPIHGRVIAASGIRLSSESKRRYGVWTPPASLVLPGCLYASNTVTERREYRGGELMIDPDATEMYLFNPGAVRPYYTHRIQYDPFPYYNPMVTLPEAITEAEGRLDQHDIDLLVYSRPLYPRTGELELHALLSLAEAGTVLGLVNMPGVLSWRAVPPHRMDLNSYPIDDPELRRILSGMDYYAGVEYVIALILQKAGWL